MDIETFHNHCRMKESYIKFVRKESAIILIALYLLAGCAGQLGKSSQGIPVRVGIQDSNGLPVELQLDETSPLPVKLQIDETSPLPVKAKVDLSEMGPFEVIIDQNKPLSVNANVQAAIQVKLAPDRSITLAIAGIGLIAVLTLIIALAACVAAISATRAAKK